MEAQRWRLAMFASCGWFWDEPARIETAGALRAAMRAARLIDGLAGTDLEQRLVADLALVSADGIGLLDAALAAVGCGRPAPTRLTPLDGGSRTIAQR